MDPLLKAAVSFVLSDVNTIAGLLSQNTHKKRTSEEVLIKVRHNPLCGKILVYSVRQSLGDLRLESGLRQIEVFRPVAHEAHLHNGTGAFAPVDARHVIGK